MRKQIILILFLCLAVFLTEACKVSKPGGDRSKPGATTYVNLASLKFTVESVNGQVQIKANRNAEWHDLAVGEVFDGYAMLRSGFQSNAILVMEQSHRMVRCELGALICSTSINDIYDRILSPPALAEYNQKMYEKDYPFDPSAPVQISREALSLFEEKESLLAQSGGASMMKGDNEQLATPAPRRAAEAVEPAAAEAAAAAQHDKLNDLTHASCVTPKKIKAA
ncbi:MAG: hypothetical protein ACYTG7_11250 [Planctomycetota bacterium]|jgi:hypothetical protein